MYLAGIDVGSTNLKAAIYDLEGRLAAQGTRATPLAHPDDAHPDWAVWPADGIWQGVCESLREAVAQIGDPRQIRGLAVTGMGMDGLPVDGNGRWLYPFISWHCPRTAGQQQWWLEHVGADRQFALSGTQIWPFNTALRLRWMAEHHPEILARAAKWLLIEDFVNFMLCGEMATDYSMASTTLLFDQRRRTWSDELLGLGGVDGRLLCDPRPAGSVLGEVHAAAAEATGLAPGTPVVLGGHDYCCGELAVGAFRPGIVSTVMGTWEMVVAALDEPILTPEVQRTGVFVDSHVARGRWTVMGAFVAADMLEWFRREFGQEERLRAEQEGGVDWDYLVAAAEAAPPGAGGVMFLPHMSGSTCPVVDPRSAGAFVGLRNAATRGALLRAVIEGLNFQCRQVVGAYEHALGVRPEKIVAVGGPTHNRFWMQNKADVLGLPIEVPECDEAVPLGAALLAGIGVGLYRDEADAFARAWRGGRCYQPDPRLVERYAEAAGRFDRLYPALRDLLP